MYDFISSKGIDPEQEFDLIELIGQGNYGKVYKVLHKKTGKIYAAKIANLGTSNEIESFKKEINVLKQCAVATSYSVDRFKEANAFSIVTELVAYKTFSMTRLLIGVAES